MNVIHTSSAGSHFFHCPGCGHAHAFYTDRFWPPSDAPLVEGEAA